MKKLLLSLVAGFSVAGFAATAQAYQYIQCESVEVREQTAFVLALGHNNQDTLYIASPLLYPTTERSELIPIEKIRAEDPSRETLVWAGQDKLYAFQVEYKKIVEGDNVDRFGALFRIEGMKTGENFAELPMICFARVR